MLIFAERICAASDFGALADLLFRQAHHAQRRNGIVIAFHIGKQRSLKGSVGELVDAEGAEERVRSHARNQVGAAADQSGLRSAQQFVAAVGDDIDASAQAVENAGFAA